MKIMNRLLLIATLTLLAAGCGGGTAGTSDTSSGRLRSFRGTFLDSQNAPLSGASVNLAGLTRATTTAAGTFDFDAESPADVDLSVETGGKELAVPVPSLDDSTTVLDIRATVNIPDNSVQSRTSGLAGKVVGECAARSSVEADVITLPVSASGGTCDIEYTVQDPGRPQGFGIIIEPAANCAGATFDLVSRGGDETAAVITLAHTVPAFTGRCDITISFGDASGGPTQLSFFLEFVEQ